MKKYLIILFCCLFYYSNAQQLPRRELMIPDIPGYSTLKCDFHLHTAFSDGEVWPVTRVTEAWESGLDAIAITDHIEYRPHKSDLGESLKRPFEIARGIAIQHGIILIRALEITRSMPPGHMNALFLTEEDSLKKSDYTDVVNEAKEQGAFVMWNHPGWDRQAPDGIKWYDIHTEYLKQVLFQGIEVVNDRDFYPEALDWALEKNLTIMGSSDMHGTLGDYLARNQFDNRPMTLVFVRQRSEYGIRDALLKRRTAVWFNNKVIGSSLYLEPLFLNSVKLVVVSGDQKMKNCKLTNTTDMLIMVQPAGEKQAYTLLPHSSQMIRVRSDLSVLEVSAPNFITGKGSVLIVKVPIIK